MFGWDPQRVVVENMLVGGGFGGKEDVSVQHLAALAAWIYKRPVKAKLTRQESIRFHPKRHAMEGTFTLGCDKNGIFTALDCDIYFDTGAYASLCGPVLERACTHSVGPYYYQNTDIRGYGYYTNNPPAGAFRGFGVCQSEFALEAMINLLAEKVDISPWEIRFRNAIVIYHTHTTEAYFPTESSPYRQTSRWRTADSERSVVAVGERLKTILERDYGFSVIHDTTDHEPPKLATAYERSEQTMRAYREQYPSIEVFIDLHRDAYGSEPKEPTDFVTVNGEQLARLMFVVGHGEAYEDKPFYETNRRFAERITDYLADVDPNLVRPIREKTGRYNQHIGAYCLLVEVGHNANTLEQALASVPYLAEGIAYAAAETEHTVTSWLPQAEN